jgi:hypothetical protein
LTRNTNVEMVNIIIAASVLQKNFDSGNLSLHGVGRGLPHTSEGAIMIVGSTAVIVALCYFVAPQFMYQGDYLGVALRTNVSRNGVGVVRGCSCFQWLKIVESVSGWSRATSTVCPGV